MITAGQYKVSAGHAGQHRGRQLRCGASARSRRNERRRQRHFRSVHPLSDRHLAADGGHPVRRPRRLSAAAGRAAAAGRLPDHPDHRQPARRQSGDHGDLRRAAAGAPVRANSRHRADDLDELSRHRFGHDPVRSQPQHRWRRQRRAGRDQRRRRAAAEEPALAADLPQGQPGGFADPAAIGNIRHAAADHGQRFGRCAIGAADQPDFRRRPGHHRRPAEAGDPRPDRSGETGRQGAVARGRAQPDRDHHRRQPEGQYRRRLPAPTPSTPTTSCSIPRTGTTSSSPIATAVPYGSGISARPSPVRRTPSRPPGPTASAACSW